MSSNTEANIAATKYAREITGFAPADDESYVSAYNHFKAGYSSRDKEVEELRLVLLKIKAHLELNWRNPKEHEYYSSIASALKS